MSQMTVFDYAAGYIHRIGFGEFLGHRHIDLWRASPVSCYGRCYLYRCASCTAPEKIRDVPAGPLYPPVRSRDFV